MAAVFLDQAGEIAAAVDLAVEALVILADVELDEIEAVRASLALSGFMFRRCAFDLAIDMGKRAFDGARLVEGVPIDVLAFTTGYVAAEGGHVATDDAHPRSPPAARARTAAAWLREHGVDDISTRMLGPALDAEVDLALGRPVERAPLDAIAELYDEAAADLVAWHRLVRGIAAARVGDMHDSIELIDAAVPGLVASADDHCLVRALRNARAREGPDGRPGRGVRRFGRVGDARHAGGSSSRWADSPTRWRAGPIWSCRARRSGARPRRTRRRHRPRPADRGALAPLVRPAPDRRSRWPPARCRR